MSVQDVAIQLLGGREAFAGTPGTLSWLCVGILVFSDHLSEIDQESAQTGVVLQQARLRK